MTRKICVVTGSRAEYGLLRPLLEEIRKDKALRLFLVVTGAHLSGEFGLTYREIEKDRFRISGKVDISLKTDIPSGIARSTGLAVSNFARLYETMKPDIVAALGDRFEIFGAVTAALISRIPVAHIGGGELTEGSIDNSFRYAITKMSHLHFVCTEEYRRRVMQLGEDPKTIFNVGSLGLDNIRYLRLLSKKELETRFGFEFSRRNLLVTFHPATLDEAPAAAQFRELLAAADNLKDTKIFFTKANADTGGKAINRMIDRYAAGRGNSIVVFDSMGHLGYLSMMRFVDGVVGNSSSGIAEAPSFKIGTVNVGDRQRGRARAASVIDCAPDRREISRAIQKIYSAGFKARLAGTVNPYAAKGSAARKIKDVLKNHRLDNILKKKFHDVIFKDRR
ncbi:MAG: UDP-N-acetylglucosamine 2-epimerase [Candidatus Omnitrophota bacterium]